MDGKMRVGNLTPGDTSGIAHFRKERINCRQGMMIAHLAARVRQPSWDGPKVPSAFPEIFEGGRPQCLLRRLATRIRTMARASVENLTAALWHWSGEADLAQLSDAELLDRYVACDDERAFPRARGTALAARLGR